ncbi:MAG TPA: FG-GAP-like repeat-containing protein [Candidatus Kapabacteria bacterium]|nr:FG-GAP-like repeat-containing protein [Candidatus Kapabacteria bacterium]
MVLSLLRILMIIACVTSALQAQNLSGPASWMYPKGNSQATYSQTEPSRAQNIDSLKLKWSTTALSGDIQPLIGNIKNNPKIVPEFLWAPNEIVALVKDRIVVVDGTGELLCETPLPSFVKYVKGISVLFDTTNTLPVGPLPQPPLVMALETIESEDTVEKVAYAYIAGYDKQRDSIIIIRRLSVDLSDFDSNYIAGVKPFIGRNINGQTTVYATVNITKPRILPNFTGAAPYFRGFTQFNLGQPGTIFPLPDTRDEVTSRITIAPEISLYQPSVGFITTNPFDAMVVTPPVYPTPYIKDIVSNSLTQSTFGDFPYLMSFPIHAALPNSYREGIPPVDLASSLITDSTRSRPLIRPYYVPLNNSGGGGGTWYVLMAEEYIGRDTSFGVSRLHLMNASGQPLTLPDDPNTPSFVGGKNHFWSIGVGDMDGVSANEVLPYYPNNPGDEIIVTQSSKEGAFAANKISVLRYRIAAPVEKINRPGTFLFPFDTLCSQRINGWVAAVNDFDGGDDRKAEVFVVDRSTVRILRMRNYADARFRFGAPFDTLRTIELPNETITALAVADLEGDGKNDIIITTLSKTFCFGSLLEGSIRLTSQKQQQIPPQTYCLGDTVNITWTNLLRGQDIINIFFQRYTDSAQWTSRRDTLFANVANNAATGQVSLVLTQPALGRQGRIIIQSANSPDIIDSSAYLRFAQSKITIDYPTQDSTVVTGRTIRFSGQASCVDTLWLQFRIDEKWAYPDSSGNKKEEWFTLTGQQYNGAFYTFDWGVPVTAMFGCSEPDLDSVIDYRIIGKDITFGIYDTSDIRRLRIVPHPLDITIDPPPAKASAERTITWNPLNNPLNLGCNEFIFAYSIDKGKTFITLDRIPITAQTFDWHLPTNAVDSSVILRICCASGVGRIDTLLTNIVVKYIKMVAPNPFAPPSEIAEVIYSVPEETNVTVRIYDQAHRLVAEPVTNQRRLPNIAYSDSWDGTTQRGLAVNGVYYFSIELANGTKEVYTVFVKKK